MIKLYLVAGIGVMFLVGECDLLPKKHTKKRTRSNTQKVAVQKAGVGGVLGSDDTGMIKVDAAWMKRYREMESRHGSIPADEMIWQEDKNFWVNSDVINHFSKMKIAENTKPASTKKSQ